MIGLSLSYGQRLSLTQKSPPTNWSLLNTFKKLVDSPPRFKKIQLDVSKMSLEDRLKAVDAANKVFHFEYKEDENKFYKIPLMRNSSVDTDDIKIRIPKKDYEKAKTTLKGAGEFQRIVRAVPYHQIHLDVKEFVKEKECTLDDVVVIGIDRGGRLPSFIVREALGKDQGYTLKVDQGRGDNGELDITKLQELITSDTLKNKFVLFVDSTVDSGRQIEVLRKYFDSDEWQEKINHKGWGIVGSNEDGQNLYNHRNINWGLNPDESFEDDPELMGVDYANGCTTRVIERPTQSSEAIKKALLEVPKGVVLDMSNLPQLLKMGKAYVTIDRVIDSRSWQNTKDAHRDLGITGLETVSNSPHDENMPRKKLLVTGDGKQTTLSAQEIDYITNSLSDKYDVIAGTQFGNPGAILSRFSRMRNKSAQLYRPKYDDEEINDEVFGNRTVFSGSTKRDFRENLVENADAVLVLGGNEGTLKEMIMATYAEKPVYILSKYGAVGNYGTKATSLKKHLNLYVIKSLKDIVDGLQEYSQH